MYRYRYTHTEIYTAGENNLNSVQPQIYNECSTNTNP